MSELPKNSADTPDVARGRLARFFAVCVAALASGCGDSKMDEVCQNAGFEEASPEANQTWEKLEDMARDKEGGPRNLPIIIDGDQIFHGHQDKAWGLEIFRRDGIIGKCVKKEVRRTPDSSGEK